ncbi:MAG: two-component system, NtrC family, sensor kinase [Solirubrobacteraceae bacterium]|jgi:signal transduction histidine kinase|nr:two-component system, NtrC family, sensor kinase [Solirubrobacteraceae bacterium]
MKAMIATLRRPWLAYLAGLGPLSVLYLAGPLNAAPVFNLIGASAVVAIVFGARRNQPSRRLPWYLFAGGQALFVLADVLAYNYTRFFGGELPFPSIADPIYLAVYPSVIAGLLMLLYRRSPGRDIASLIDSLIVTIGLGTLSWIYLMAPYATDAELGMSTKLISMAYPVMDVLLLAVAVRLAVSAGRRGLSFLLLTVGIVALLITDAIYGWLLLHGGYETGGLLDGGWIVFYGLLGAAALHPSMRLLGEPQPAPAVGLTAGRLAMLGGATLLVPGVQIAHALAHAPLGMPVVTGGASIALFTLVVARMAGLVRLQEATARRERVLREEAEELMAERDRMELELRLAQKLEAVGQLAAGMAHEINTPIQFVGDTVRFLDESFTDVLKLIDDYRSALARLADGRPPEEIAREVAEAEDLADLAYLEERIPKSFARAFDGIGRVATIVRAMREFAHPPTSEMAPAQLNAAIENTLIVAANEYRYVAEVETALVELPPVLCNVGDVNQVILNLVVNASHAIQDAVGDSGEKGVIRVSTRRDGDEVVITVADNGAGIPDDVAPLIFDPFFTTKDVGRGTGQGLAIARTIVTERHGGSLTFTTVPGEGTTFEVRLPVAGLLAPDEAAA